MQRRWVGFPGVAPIRGAPRSGCLRRSVFHHHPSPNADFGPHTSQSSTVVPQPERGELDGAKEANGG
jgi:hypothetical protein